jgi:hypothetical protein
MIFSTSFAPLNRFFTILGSKIKSIRYFELIGC